MDCGPSLRNIGQCILELLNRKCFGTFNPGDLDLWPSDSSINRVLLLPRTDLCTKSEEGRSRCSRDIDRKRVTDGQTDRPTNMCNAIMPSLHALSSSKGGIKTTTTATKTKLMDLKLCVIPKPKLFLSQNTILCCQHNKRTNKHHNYAIFMKENHILSQRHCLWWVNMHKVLFPSWLSMAHHFLKSLKSVLQRKNIVSNKLHILQTFTVSQQSK